MQLPLPPCDVTVMSILPLTRCSQVSEDEHGRQCIHIPLLEIIFKIRLPIEIKAR
jgi:hypothetical protein